MEKSKVMVVVAALMILAIVSLFLFMQGEDVAMIEPEALQDVPGIQKSEPEPLVRHRLPQPEAQLATPKEEIAITPPEPPKPLPSLEDSDGDFFQELSVLVDEAQLKRILRLDTMLNRLAVTVDNMTSRSLPNKHLITKSVKGQFLTTPIDHKTYTIDPRNYKRYEIYVTMLEEVDVQQLVALYVRYFPLLQQAFELLGYPDQYFNDKVIALIDHMLETPDLTESPVLILPSVMYRYQDPALENLSASQKVLIRMGPDNAARVKQRLSEMREVITGFKQSQG